MPLANSLSALPEAAAVTPSLSRRYWRTACRIVVLAFAVCQLWVYRYVTDADCIAYVDVARAWLRGDWLHALNPYWSPLYVWLLTAALALFHPSIHWLLPLIHAINLMGFVAAFAAWEWLIAEWEHWQGSSSNPFLTDVVCYCVFIWAGLRLNGLGWYNTPDVFVMALLLVAGALLLRVRRGAATNRDFVLLGLALGFGFLAKTAVITVIPLFLLTLAVLLRSGRDRRLLLTAFTTFLIAAPFVAAISLAHHRFTVGDSGRLNFSWHVTGISVEGYKENAYWPGPEVQHPIPVLLEHPRVLSYAPHPVGTLPIHSNPSWWSAGYPVRFNKARELMILWSDIKFSINAFRCPALLLILIALPFGAREIIKRFAQVWFLWAPALLFALIYCPVASEFRYLSGSYALTGFALVIACWRIRWPRLLALSAVVAIPLLTAGVLMGANFRHIVPQFIGEIRGRRAPWDYFNMQDAEIMRQQGLQPGDRVAYIGFALGAAHVGLEQAHIVASVPERVAHDDTIPGRPLVFTFAKPDAFWHSSPQVQQQVFDAFRSVGAKWVFADCIPEWANIAGWQKVGDSHIFRAGDRPYLYFRRLE